MIFGIGIDSIRIERVIKAMERKHFYDTIFTPLEQAEISNNKRRCASDFAGKEAVVKMFGTGFGIIHAEEIEILRHRSGAPYVKLYGAALEFANTNGIEKIHISITNTEDVATAYVVGEKS